MEQEILDRARQALREQGLSAALLSNPASIAWLTGYAPPILSGPSPFEGGPAVAWFDDERVILLVSDAEQGAAAATGAECRTYVGYQIEGILRPATALASALGDLLSQPVPRSAVIGVESLPSNLWNKVASAWPDRTLREIDGWTDSLRVVKTATEIDKIQASCALCSAAQAMLRALPLEGRSEIELYGTVAAAMEQQAGERLPILCDFVAGVRTAQIGGPPTAYVVQPGDPVLADIVPRLNGYWGDICNVHFAGDLSDTLRKVYVAVRVALNAAIDAVRPGVPASNIDLVARQAIGRQGFTPHPHHTGHGVGVTYHEEPRICAYNDMRLQPGMVIALEPGIYVEGVGGVRLEHVLAVTADGAKLLTQHSMDI